MSTAFPTPENNQPAQPTQPEKKKGGCMKWGAVALGVLVVLGVAGSCMGGNDDSDNPATTTVTSETEVATPATDSTSEVTAEPSSAAPAAPAAPADTNDDVPREYKNALRQAEMYLKTQGFSEAGLRDQLMSEYGGQFPADAADYALANVKADWNAEALEAAQAYQSTMPMSDDQLFDQLTSPYGGKFTPEQAQYAIDNLG